MFLFASNLFITFIQACLSTKDGQFHVLCSSYISILFHRSSQPYTFNVPKSCHQSPFLSIYPFILFNGLYTYKSICVIPPKALQKLTFTIKFFKLYEKLVFMGLWEI